MLYHFVQANLDKHNKITASAIKHFTIICENLKPKSSLEKIMLWQSHFECADLLYKQGDKSQAITLLKKVAKDGHSARFKSPAVTAIAYIEAN